MQRYQNSLHFKFFLISVEGGGRRKSIFSQIQNSPHYPRGGGSRKLWTFSTICEIFCLECSPKLCSTLRAFITFIPSVGLILYTMLEVIHFLLILTCIVGPLATLAIICYKFRSYLPSLDSLFCLCKILCCYFPFLWKLISPQCCSQIQSSPV